MSSACTRSGRSITSFMTVSGDWGKARSIIARDEHGNEMPRSSGSGLRSAGSPTARTLACLAILGTALVSPVAAHGQGLPAADPAELGLSPPRLERIPSPIERDIAAGLIPGAVMLVGRNGRTAYFDAF